MSCSAVLHDSSKAGTRVGEDEEPAGSCGLGTDTVRIVLAGSYVPDERIAVPRIPRAGDEASPGPDLDRYARSTHVRLHGPHVEYGSAGDYLHHCSPLSWGPRYHGESIKQAPARRFVS